MFNIFKFRYSDYVETERDIWFANLYFNALVKLNRKSGRIEKIDKFPNYKVGEEWLYTAVCKVGEELVFVPHKSKEVLAYNMNTGRFKSSPLNLEILGKREQYFFSAYTYGQYVYMFPNGARHIIRYDVSQHVITYLDSGLSKVLEDLSDTARCFFCQYEVVGDKVYIPFAELNAVAVFIPENEKLLIRYLGIEGGCSTITLMDGYFYLTAWKKNKIYRWNEKTSEVKIFEIPTKENEQKAYAFVNTYVTGHKIFFLSQRGDTVLSFDASREMLHIERGQLNTENEVLDLYFVKKNGERYVAMVADNEDLCLLDYRDERLRFLPCYKQDICYNEHKISDFLLAYGYFDEIYESDRALALFLKTMLSAGKIYNQRNINRKSCGKEIWDNICIRN